MTDDVENGDLLAAEVIPIPYSFMCSLTHEVFEDPVLTIDGHVYERAPIELWFRQGHRTSPLTGANLPSLQLTPDVALKGAIEEYLKLRPELQRRAAEQRDYQVAMQAWSEELAGKHSIHNEEMRVLKLRIAELEARLRDANIQLVEGAQDPSSGTWTCSQCTLVNTASSTQCEICETLSPPQSPAPAQPPTPLIAEPTPAPTVTASFQVGDLVRYRDRGETAYHDGVVTRSYPFQFKANDSNHTWGRAEWLEVEKAPQMNMAYAAAFHPGC